LTVYRSIAPSPVDLQMEILPKTKISEGADEAPDVIMLGGMEELVRSILPDGRLT